jgi:hypothetical protein
MNSNFPDDSDDDDALRANLLTGEEPQIILISCTVWKGLIS